MLQSATFRFTGQVGFGGTTITDFDVTEDEIDLQGISVNDLVDTDTVDGLLVTNTDTFETILFEGLTTADYDDISFV